MKYGARCSPPLAWGRRRGPHWVILVNIDYSDPATAFVAKLVIGLLTEKPSLDKETLKARVAATIADLGKSKQGMNFVLPRVLRNTRFREKDGKYMLKNRRLS